MVLRFFGAIFENSVSIGFAFIISLVFVLAVLSQFTERFGRFEGLYRYGSTLLPTLGVLGTFVGIALGLLDFDVGNIDKSVPPLLEGLKVAFMTSIIGLGAAILLRAVQIATPRPETEETEVTPEVIHSALKSIREGIDEAATQEREALEHLRKSISADNDSSLLTQVQALTAIKEGIDTAATQQQESLENLRKSISAEGDSSLLTQVQKLRTDFKDGQNEMTKEFRQFAETMAENNSKALIEALEQVIRDFNTQLNEQFGENFKQLNEAVRTLLTWQENYRVHVEALEHRLEIAVRAVEASEQALSKITDHTQQIPETLQNLRDLLKGLDEHLTTVAGLRDKAVEAFPVIDANLTKLTTELTEAVGQAIQRSENALQHQQNAHDKLHQGFDDLLKNAQRSRDNFDKALNDALSKTSTGMERQFEKLNREMGQTLHQSIEEMGGHLASLSEKFVKDYSPLTARLREVVQIASRVKN